MLTKYMCFINKKQVYGQLGLFLIYRLYTFFLKKDNVSMCPKKQSLVKIRYWYYICRINRTIPAIVNSIPIIADAYSSIKSNNFISLYTYLISSFSYYHLNQYIYLQYVLSFEIHLKILL